MVGHMLPGEVRGMDTIAVLSTILTYQSWVSQQGILWKGDPRVQDLEQGRDGREWS